MKQNLKEILKWQIEAGVSDSISLNTSINSSFDIKPSTNSSLQSKSLKEKTPQVITPESKPMPKDEVKTVSSANAWVKKAEEASKATKTLEELKHAVESFDGLAIKKTATNCVFADGNPKSNLMLIGEAPGENEDLKGIPFCGVSGRLLDKMFNFAGYSREKNLYITNTVFWRPPGNRKPTPEEIAMCKPFLQKHIELMKPKVIVLVGATATFSVLNNSKSISVLKKSMHFYENEGVKTPCFAIYHPSYLLRQPTQKKNAWSDILKIKKYIEHN